jgi:peptidoglycan hydrolase FlgJ
MNDALSLPASSTAGDRMDSQIESLKAISLDRNKKLTQKQMRETSNQFEEIVFRQLLKEMRKTVPKEGILEESHASEMYMDMVDDNLSKQMASANAIGIGDMVYNELKEKNEKAVDPREIKKQRDFIELETPDGVAKKMDFIPMQATTETFMKLHNKNQMMDLPKASDPYKPLDWKLRVATDQIQNQ